MLVYKMADFAANTELFIHSSSQSRPHCLRATRALQRDLGRGYSTHPLLDVALGVLSNARPYAPGVPAQSTTRRARSIPVTHSVRTTLYYITLHWRHRT